MNYFSDGITKGLLWDSVANVCDKYLRLSIHLQTSDLKLIMTYGSHTPEFI